MGAPKSNQKSSIVKSTKEFRDALKEVVKFNLTTVSDYIHDIIKISMREQAKICPLVGASLMLHAQTKSDGRVGKPCAGWACMKCKHKEDCIAGNESCLFEMREEHVVDLRTRGFAVETTYETVTMKVPVTRIFVVEPE